MAKVKEWNDNMKTLTNDHLFEVEKALRVLVGWNLFEREYPEMVHLWRMASEIHKDRYQAELERARKPYSEISRNQGG
jgi:hypothetical protein